MPKNRPLLESLERLRNRTGPMLSLYLPIAAGESARSARTAQTRANRTLQRLEVPGGIRDRVLQTLEGALHGRVAAMFADEDGLELIPLDFDLPIVDPVTGEAEGHWGEPYLLPLEMSLRQQGDAAAIYVDGERVRVFDVFAGRAELIFEETRSRSAAELDTLEESSKTIHPAYIADRGSSATDDAAEHVKVLTERFYQDVGRRLSSQLDQRCVIVLGPNGTTTAFERHLVGGVKDKVIARLGALHFSEASAHDVYERIEPVLREHVAAQEAKLLDDIADHGVRGVDSCLELLQRGRLSHLAMPWHADGEVYVDTQTGFAATSAEAARAQASGEIERHPLEDEILRLADRFSVDLHMVTGPHRDRLVQEFGGLGGIQRW